MGTILMDFPHPIAQKLPKIVSEVDTYLPSAVQKLSAVDRRVLQAAAELTDRST